MDSHHFQERVSQSGARSHLVSDQSPALGRRRITPPRIVITLTLHASSTLFPTPKVAFRKPTKADAKDYTRIPKALAAILPI